MKIHPFCNPQITTGIPLHGKCIRIHVHYTNTQMTTMRHQANIGISQSPTTHYYAPYSTHPPIIFFHSLLTDILYLYDTNHYTTLPHTTHYPAPPQKNTPPQNPQRHRSITTNLNKWARVLNNIRRNNPTLLVYTHYLVTTLSPNNYSRVTMNIIDHIYIEILPPSLHITILDNLTIFAKN